MSAKKILLTVIIFVTVLVACNQPASRRDAVNDEAGKATTQSPDQITGAVNALSVDDAINAYEQSVTQHFKVMANTTTEIIGQHGLKVKVDPGVLVMENGAAPTGNIKVQMIELTNSDALFKSNAATMSNGKLLVSGGSYFIGMTCNGMQVNIRPGKSISMTFPKLKRQEMQLFYGNRDNRGNMNWNKAATGKLIQQQYDSKPYLPPFNDSMLGYSSLPFKSKFKLYDSTNTIVQFMDKRMTLKAMVDLLQQRGVDKNLDSLFISSKQYYGTTSYDKYFQEVDHYIKKYRIISCKQLAEEQDSLRLLAEKRYKMLEANRRYLEAYYAAEEEDNVNAQIQRFYAPTMVGKLGWINCDRFYDNPTNIDMPVELPYTFQGGTIQYFLVYKKFNGLMSGFLELDVARAPTLRGLPGGELVTMIAFTKNNGQLYQCKNELTIQKGKKILLDFKPISAEVMRGLFGKNATI